METARISKKDEEKSNIVKVEVKHDVKITKDTDEKKSEPLTKDEPWRYPTWH
jgi:hypothetical protein